MLWVVLGLGLGLVVAPLSAVGCVGFGVRSGGSAIECCGLCWVWG